jgi:(p)ppGpp synthase/HD superfamily hydrolase
MSGSWSQDAYIAAFRFAAAYHNQQKLPGTDWPYIVHVGLVCMEVLAAIADDPHVDGDLAVQCALLHDTIEDTDATYEMLRDAFGPHVADGVLALTKNTALAGEDRLKDSLRRIRQQPREVWMVKLADRVTNLQNPPADWSETKRKSYLEDARQILDALESASPNLSSRLSEKMAAYLDLSRTSTQGSR